MRSAVARASLSVLCRVYLDWWGICLEQRQRDFPPFLTSPRPVLSNTLLPTVFLASHHFYINLFLRSSVFFCTFSSIPAQLLFDLPHRSLGVLSHHYCLCLPSLSLLGISVSAQFSYPTHFMNLIPFLALCFQVWGQISILLSLLPHHSLSGSLTALLSLHNHRECLSIRGISLILDEIVFRICNLREHRNALLFISLYSR